MAATAIPKELKEIGRQLKYLDEWSQNGTIQPHAALQQLSQMAGQLSRLYFNPDLSSDQIKATEEKLNQIQARILPSVSSSSSAPFERAVQVLERDPSNRDIAFSSAPICAQFLLEQLATNLPLTDHTIKLVLIEGQRIAQTHRQTHPDSTDSILFAEIATEFPTLRVGEERGPMLKSSLTQILEGTSGSSSVGVILRAGSVSYALVLSGTAERCYVQFFNPCGHQELSYVNHYCKTFPSLDDAIAHLTKALSGVLDEIRLTPINLEQLAAPSGMLPFSRCVSELMQPLNQLLLQVNSPLEFENGCKRIFARTTEIPSEARLHTIEAHFTMIKKSEPSSDVRSLVIMGEAKEAFLSPYTTTEERERAVKRFAVEIAIEGLIAAMNANAFNEKKSIMDQLLTLELHPKDLDLIEKYLDRFPDYAQERAHLPPGINRHSIVLRLCQIMYRQYAGVSMSRYKAGVVGDVRDAAPDFGWKMLNQTNNLATQTKALLALREEVKEVWNLK